MNEKINLCNILKDCPKGTKLYSTVLGNVFFDGVQGTCDNDFDYCILVSAMTRYDTIAQMELTREGHFNNLFPEAECVLWPSKDVKTWEGWKCPKPKFDPKTLKAYDKILVRDNSFSDWTCTMFSHYTPYDEFPIKAVFNLFRYGIPYNEETKHLVGTKDDAPEYYRYWEDGYECKSKE